MSIVTALLTGSRSSRNANTEQLKLLSDASVSGGALELEDLAGVVGAVGLLATLADEFVGKEQPPPPSSSVESHQSDFVANTNGETKVNAGASAPVSTPTRGASSAGSALRQSLSDMAKEFFKGANKVRWSHAVRSRTNGLGSGPGQDFTASKEIDDVLLWWRLRSGFLLLLWERSLYRHAYSTSSDGLSRCERIVIAQEPVHAKRAEAGAKRVNLSPVLLRGIAPF